jgi:hypothetical protein
VDTEKSDLAGLSDSKVLAMLVTDMEFLGLIKLSAITDALRLHERVTIQQDNAARRAA